MMTWREDEKRVQEEAAKFPKVFGLRRFPGKRFEIVLSQSYVSDDKVLLYVFLEGGDAFAKGTPEELRREIVEVK